LSPSFTKPVRVLVAAVLALAIALAASASVDSVELERAAASVSIAGVVTDPRVDEISGLAASRRRSDLWWAHNDSGNPNSIFALTTSGTVVAEFEIEGVRNTDWEDMASFEMDGRPWLLIADIGDNGGLRATIQLILVSEPEVTAAAGGTVRPERVLSARWPDGPRDAESVAVDPATRTVYLLAKRRVPAQLFALPLDAPDPADEVRTIRQIGTVPGIPQPSQSEITSSPEIGRWLGQPTGMDRRADGSFVVITYRDAYLFLARPGDDAVATLRRTPMRLGLPPMPQAEAVAFSRDGRVILATTEKLPAAIVRAKLGPGAIPRP
jgi:hypothetical protein